MLKEIIETASRGRRLDPDQALHLYEKADLLSLGRLAQTARFRHNPHPVATYAVDRNINYTDICVSGCAFCAFYKEKEAPEAYEIGRASCRERV